MQSPNQSTYQNITLSDFVSRVCNPSYNTTPNQLKQSIYRMLLKIQDIELNKNDDGLMLVKNPHQNSQIVQKLQMKMIEMEERRKLWDLKMADHLTEKDKYDQILKTKLGQLSNGLIHLKNINDKVANIQEQVYKCNDRVDANTKDIKNTLLQQEQKIFKMEQEILEKTNSLRMDVKNIEERISKGEKNQEGFELSLGSKIEEILRSNKISQSDPNGKVHFEISCNELTVRKCQVQRSSLSDQQYEDNKGDISEKHDERCGNISLIVSNFEKLEQVQNYMKDNDEVMERFQNKLIKIFDNIEVLQSKFADFLQGKGSISQLSQSHNQTNSNVTNNKPEPITSGSNSSVTSNNIPINSSFKPPVTASNSLAPLNNAQNSYFGNLMQNQQQPIVQPDRQPFPSYLLANTPFDYKFSVKNDLITYLEANQATSSVIFGKYLMKARRVFSVSIVRSKSKYICIGVADVNLYYMPDVWGQQNFAMMRGFEGEIYSGPNQIIKKTHEKFNVGDQVIVAFDPKDGRVTWYINNKLVAKFRSKKFSDPSISWVPIIRFFNARDSVKWNYQENKSI